MIRGRKRISKIKKFIEATSKEVIISMLAVVVAAIGILISFLTAYMTISTTKHQNAMQNVFVDQQNALQRKVAYSELFANAIAHLHDEKLAVRCGATYELKKIAIESEEDREMIVDILTKFVREGIQNGRDEECEPDEDIYVDDISLADDVRSFLITEYKISVNPEGVKKSKLLLAKDLSWAKRQEADLSEVEFPEEADLS